MSGRILVLVAACGLLASPAGGEEGQETPIPIPDGDFEAGGRGWQIPQGEGMSRVTTGRAASGRRSLHVKDTHPKNGSNVTSEYVAIPGPHGRAGAFELRGKLLPVSGSGLGIYVRVYDANRRKVTSGDDHLRGLGGSSGKWETFAIPFYTSKQARYLQVWIHSYSGAEVEAYLDDLEFAMMAAGAVEPPWERQYKIRPEEKDRLTPADVVGPDGVVYPNWKHTGVQGGATPGRLSRWPIEVHFCHRSGTIQH